MIDSIKENFSGSFKLIKIFSSKFYKFYKDLETEEEVQRTQHLKVCINNNEEDTSQNVNNDLYSFICINTRHSSKQPC